MNIFDIEGICGVSHLRLCCRTAASRANTEFWRASGTRKREKSGALKVLSPTYKQSQAHPMIVIFSGSSRQE